MIIKYDTGEKSIPEKIADKGKTYINKSNYAKTKLFLKNTYKTTVRGLENTWNSPLMLPIKKLCTSLYTNVPWIHILVVIIREGTGLWIRYFAEFLSVFALTFLTLPFLILLFERIPILFFLFFFPTVILNTLALSALYRFIDRTQKGEKTSLRHNIRYCFKQILPITLLIAFYCFFITVAVALFVGLALGTSSILSNAGIDWFKSYYYWLTTLSVGTFLASLVFILTLLSQHVYYAFLLDKANPLEEVGRIYPLMKQYYVSTFPLFFLLLLLFIPVMFWLSISYLDIGVGFLLLLIFHATFLFSYLLKKHLLTTQHADSSSAIPHSWFVVGFIFGTFSYILAMFTVLSYHTTLMQFINRLQQDRAIAQELVTYTNDDYGYAISYPRTWRVYQWQPNVTTLFDNNTGTFIGGVWVNITVTYIKKTDYQQLIATKDDTTLPKEELNVLVHKLHNTTIDGANGVKYTKVKSDFPLSEYETHYLIKKDDLAYDISFMTKSRDIEEDNQLLFEKMITSFRFRE